MDTTITEDPFPVDSLVWVIDHDGTQIGPYKVVRSYWPSACCELGTDHGMVRQSHDRMRRIA